ncbi:hypothetical protein HYFRA_00010138 [Hymenoscyphus fraxineus]|uniref:2EXR domain-containing protein n=1 Tax=Hymenoscyphus fraxineus TaxID=746836 RepID=A0A9N9PRR5_9HELO|nr:hypothetical protein HYFRA_00010138 [Hymenoscyphus fraxineus]
MATPMVDMARLQHNELQEPGAFFMFPFMPIEIQTMVWEEHIKTEGTLDVGNLQSADRYTLAKLSPQKSLQVCKASRTIGLKQMKKHIYTTTVWNNGQRKKTIEARYIHLFPDTTIIFRNSVELENLEIMGNRDQRTLFRSFDIKRIAIMDCIQDTGVQIRVDPTYRPRAQELTNVVEIIPRFLSLEEIIIVKPIWADNDTSTRRKVNRVIQRMKNTWRSDLVASAPIWQDKIKRRFNKMGIAASFRPSSFWDNPQITTMSHHEFVSLHAAQNDAVVWKAVGWLKLGEV